MAAVSPALLQLAQRLRELREQQWPDVRLTQAMLAQALGDLAPATVSSWESPISPKLPPAERLLAYARFFATRRSIDGGVPALLAESELTEDEHAACRALEAELLSLREDAHRPGRRAESAVRRSWHFSDSGPLTIVCAQLPDELVGPYANPQNPNYTELQSFADLDALIELHGHIRAENPGMEVFFKASPTVVPDDLSGHVVLLGGIAWNDVTLRLSEMARLPVRQVPDPAIETGEIFVAEVGGAERRFLPRWTGAPVKGLAEDVGFLARTPNPLNSSRTLTICNGIHSRGVLGAVRSLTDARLRDSNEDYLARNSANARYFAVLARVPVIGAQALTPDFNSPECVLYEWSGDKNK